MWIRDGIMFFFCVMLNVDKQWDMFMCNDE